MRLPRWPGAGSPRAGAGSRRPPYSLFGEILDWMLAPLLFLWPISIIATHHVAQGIADKPYDRALEANVAAIARLIQVDAGGRVTVNFPAPARALLRADEEDAIYYQVIGPRGEVVVGDAELPLPPPEPEAADDAPERPLRFDDVEIAGEEVRVARRRFLLPDQAGEAIVQVAETRNKREALASRIVTGVLLPQFLVIPATVVLVWLGLTRGIAPLSRLQGLIRRRRPADLSPIEPMSVPEEVRPLIVAFNDMMARLDENLQAQQRFVADAAHQMRTPLAGLKMQTELALSESDPQVLHESLGRIHLGAQRAAHLINQLLALARAEASSHGPSGLERIDLELLAREVATEFVPRAMAKQIDLGVETTGWPLAVDGIPILLREMLKNLIDNAIKYTPQGGKVTVFTAYDAERPRVAVLGVQDDGIGIPPEDHARVFERFYRVLGSGVEGSGLGLPIVREIADLHAATIRLESGPERRGTRFVIEFPRAGEPVMAPPTAFE
ncbi:sensor histidine kinase N-terminal domain-containing protein [Niveibacterium sp. 24ML]|uniref:sensor histidine kinase n=1 Tax=Niveibacterium sp. 24ML TaxID=2985512 RepID=UPI00226E7335|nr:sensor histidine kinase [Niveibacterium sp. 24ML]MCX9154630.1 sensor histidine kinase N-terminal domain-containing protein [Niveibacterium sp. 24ML]